MKKLLVLPNGVLTAAQRKELSEAGYIAIETDAPDAVRLIAASELGLSADMLSMAALGAIQESQSSAERSRFTKLLFQELSNHRAARKAS